VYTARRILTMCMGYRQRVALAEERLAAAFTELVLKLNDALFKPMLARLVAWAGDGVDAGAEALALSPTAVGRTAVLFRLQDHLADTLKVRAAGAVCCDVAHSWTRTALSCVCMGSSRCMCRTLGTCWTWHARGWRGWRRRRWRPWQWAL
jgi:hypothetical protein